MGEQSPWCTVNRHFFPALLCHRLKNVRWVGVDAKSDFLWTMLVTICRSETHNIDLGVTRVLANCIKCCVIVHVGVIGIETPFRMIYDIGASKRAFIEFVDVTGIEVLSCV